MDDFRDIILSAKRLVDTAIPIAVAVALLVFFWGIAMSLRRAGGKNAGEAREVMKWGLITLFVMVSVWGIIGLFQRMLGLPDLTATSNKPVPGQQPTLGNPPEPGLLPSRNIFFWPSNEAQPGVLPDRSLVPASFEPFK